MGIEDLLQKFQVFKKNNKIFFFFFFFFFNLVMTFTILYISGGATLIFEVELLHISRKDEF